MFNRNYHRFIHRMRYGKRFNSDANQMSWKDYFLSTHFWLVLTKFGFYFVIWVKSQKSIDQGITESPLIWQKFAELILSIR